MSGPALSIAGLLGPGWLIGAVAFFWSGTPGDPQLWPSIAMTVAPVPALLGLVLAIVAMARGHRPQALTITSLALCAFCFPVSLLALFPGWANWAAVWELNGGPLFG